MISAQTLKGFRDFLPSETRKRQYVLAILKKVFESYGFEPLETPAVEYDEILSGKYGEAQDKLMYRFVDNGGRKVALRYDQTVPLARVIAQYQEKLVMPFKRYQIQNAWRAENPQRGRYREFLQCDIDTVGSESILADAEIIACVLNCVKELGFKNYCLKVNDRRIFGKFDFSKKALVELDKLQKQGKEPFIKRLILEGKSKQEAEEVFNLITGFERPKEVTELFSVLENMGYREGEFVFDPTIVRGLDYYTSFIFELQLKDYGNLSLGGGGRYNSLIGIFSDRQIPAVGFAFGFDRLVEAMDDLKIFPESAVGFSAKALICLFDQQNFKSLFEIASLLRLSGIGVQVFLDLEQPLDKQLRYADRKKIPYVLIIGPEEANKDMVKIKNMKTGEQKVVKKERLATIISEDRF